MNSSKKIFKIVLLCIGSGLVIGIIITICFYKLPKKYVFLTVPNDYFVVNTNFENSLDILMFSTEEENPYLKQDEIKKVSLLDDDKNDQYSLEIKHLVKLSKVVYEKNNYYSYDLKVMIPYHFENLNIMSKCYLLFEYENDETIKLYIGSICFYNYKEDTDVKYINLKCETENINNQIILKSILIKINRSILIKSIEPISSNAFVDMSMTTTVKDSTLLEGIKYNPLEKGKELKDLYYRENDYLAVYLKYNQLIETETVGLVIEYIENNEIKKLIIPPFKFYSTSKEKNICKYEHYPN